MIMALPPHPHKLNGRHLGNQMNLLMRSKCQHEMVFQIPLSYPATIKVCPKNTKKSSMNEHDFKRFLKQGFYFFLKFILLSQKYPTSL